MTDPKVTAVTHPYREGQRFDEIRVVYANGVPAGITDSDIAVCDRTITDIRRSGNEIVIGLDKDDEGAKELFVDPDTAKKPVPGAPFNPAMVMPLTEYRAPHARLCIGSVKLETTEVYETIVDEFASGKKYRLYYNLYSPETAEGARYPLVVFIPDASVNQDDPRLALLHGMGATSFATDEVQSDDPCFVLAIQIPPRIPFVSDDYSCADEFDDIKRIIDDVMAENPIDAGRIYVLGGSQGCMSSAELNCRYPNFFAASILAGGQWDPTRMGRCCAGANLWIFVSDGDEKAYPGMMAVTEALKENGADIRTFHMNAKAPLPQKEAEIRRQGEERCDIRFTIFDDHSVVPDGAPDNGGTNHMGTWPEVYSYAELKRWLFMQHL